MKFFWNFDTTKGPWLDCKKIEKNFHVIISCKMNQRFLENSIRSFSKIGSSVLPFVETVIVISQQMVDSERYKKGFGVM